MSSANQRSTRFNHDELVGVKWKWNLGWRNSQVFIAGVLCVEELSNNSDRGIQLTGPRQVRPFAMGGLRVGA